MTAEVAGYSDNKENEVGYTINLASDDELVERGATIPFNADPVRTYLQQIGKTALINAEQEIELSKRIEAGVYAEHLLANAEAGDINCDGRGDHEYWQDLMKLAEDGKAAKNHMTEANLRLVVSIAKRYSSRGLPFLDIIQEGNLGLSHAVEMFDYKKGYKFSTYATWWIRQSITRAIADKGRIIRVPVHMNEKLVKFDRIKRDMAQTLGREVTLAEMAQEMDVPLQEVMNLIKYSRQEPTSLNLPVGETGGRGQTDTEFGDVIADDSTPTAEAVSEYAQLKEAFEKILDTFSEKEADVIRMRYGFGGKKPKTLDEIGAIYGLTRERIRQIENKTMIKLRQSHRNSSLRVFLDNS